ncbi:MAG: hypothetical protein JSS81_22570 [Acidobacteria bacterium]|nr:hypothetical protein [Acidobacteriota bacterium]
MPRFPVFFWLFLCVFGALAVPAQYRFDSWTTDDGLPQNGVRGIAQAPDGYLWFTTFDGLVRFDGMKFTVFNTGNSKGLVSNRFLAVYAAPDGSVWAGTEGGDLTIYRNGAFTSYPAEQVPENQILGFQPDADGATLIHAEDNFYGLRDGRFVTVRPTGAGDARQFHVGPSGTRWENYPNETREIRTDGTRTYPVGLRFLTFYGETAYEDRKGGLWLGDVGRLYYLRDGSIVEYTEKDGLPKTLPHNFWEEADGSLWCATGSFNVAGAGLLRFKDGKFERFGREQGLSSETVGYVFKDREGTVWLATDKGLNRLRRQIVSPLTTSAGLSDNEVYPMLKTAAGDIYVGTAGGLNLYRDGRFSKIAVAAASPSAGNVQSLAEDAGKRLWIGTVGGLFVLEKGKTHDLSKTLGPPPTVPAILADRRGSVWVATESSGVFEFRNDRIVARYTTADGLPSDNVKLIHEAADGSLWFGTYGGLAHFENGKFTNYTTRDGLASDFVRALREDADGTLWIGTYDGGLSRFKNGRFFNFNTGNGLSNNGVFAIEEDARGNFWISSNKGIYRAAKRQLDDFADGRILHYESFAYGKADGMPSSECNGGRQPASMKDARGRIWFPTLEGIAIVDPDALQSNPVPPPVAIESVEIDRESTDFGRPVEFGPSQIHLDIAYTGLSFVKSDQVHFRYRLEGLDPDWIDAGTRRTVNYTHLPPGEYTFTVIAANSDGVWNPDGKSVKIVVVAPFYKTLRFWLALLAAAAVVAYLVYRYRIRQLERISEAHETFSRQLIESQERERKRIAQELHDGLGQNLLIIKNRAQLGLAVKDKDEQFGEIRESVTDALAEVRAIAYNLRPLHIDRLGLTSTIEEMIEEIEEVSGIAITYDVAPIDDFFSKENEINFYRIVQECLNNIVKHSRAQRASVSIFRETRKLVLNIRDDGAGFDAVRVNEKRGLGLNGIAERAKILGGTYAIESEPGKGTTVAVEIGF